MGGGQQSQHQTAALKQFNLCFLTAGPLLCPFSQCVCVHDMFSLNFIWLPGETGALFPVCHALIRDEDLMHRKWWLASACSAAAASACVSTEKASGPAS